MAFFGGIDTENGRRKVGTMLKVSLTGIKDGVNTAFTISSLGVGVFFIVWAKRILKEVEVTPGPYEYTRSGTAIVLGSAPAVGDMLYGYVQSDLKIGLKEIVFSGTRNGVNTGYTISELPLSGSNILVFKNGEILEEASVAPTSIQFTISSSTLILGSALLSTDKLRVFVASPGTAIIQRLPLRGTQDSINTRFLIPRQIKIRGYEPLLLILHDGILQARAVKQAGLGEYAQDSEGFTLGSAPSDSSPLQCFVIANIKIAETSLFANDFLANRLMILLQQRLDFPEAEEAVSQAIEEIVAMYQWSFLNVSETLVTEKDKNTGTVSVTNGSRIVALSGGTLTQDDIGKMVSIGGDGSYVYRITSINGQNIEIYPPYVGTTAVGQKYSVRKFQYILPVEVGQIINMVSDQPIVEVPISAIHQSDPLRSSSSSSPSCFAYCGTSESGASIIELSPCPSSQIVIRYTALLSSVSRENPSIVKELGSLIINMAAAIGCRMLLLKPNPASSVTESAIAALVQSYEGKAFIIGDRLVSLDLDRSDVPDVQGMREDYGWVDEATHDNFWRTS